MPPHQRTRSTQRASSVPPASPPPYAASRQSNAAREKARRTPIVPSARRKHALETVTESSASRHLQAALAALPNGPRRSSAPTVLGSPFTLKPTHGRRRSSRASISMSIKEQSQAEDEDMLVIESSDTFLSALDARAYDWRIDPFGDSPVHVYGQRPNFKRQEQYHHHRRASSSSTMKAMMSSLHPYSSSSTRTPQPTLLSATPSPAISAANSPYAHPLELTPDMDFSLLLPTQGVPRGWPSFQSDAGLRTPGLLSTPSFATPALSPSASSTTGTPYNLSGGRGTGNSGAAADYFGLSTPRTDGTPGTPGLTPY